MVKIFLASAESVARALFLRDAYHQLELGYNERDLRRRPCGILFVEASFGTGRSMRQRTARVRDKIEPFLILDWLFLA